MAEMTKGKVATLIDNAAIIDDTIKELQVSLKEIKGKLDAQLDPGKYITKKGRGVTVSETTTYTDMDPVETRKLLKTKRFGKKFYECVKVNISCVKRYLSDVEIATLRDSKGISRRYCFK